MKRLLSFKKNNRLSGHKFEQTPGDGEEQESLAFCKSMGLRRIGHDLVAEQQVRSRASRDGCEGRVPVSRCQQGCVPGEGCCSSSSLLDHTGWSPTAGATPKTLCKTEALWFYDRERAQGLPTYAGGHPHPGRQRDCGWCLPHSACPTEAPGLPGADSPPHCCSRDPRRTCVLPGRCRSCPTSERPCSGPDTCSGRHLGREESLASGREPDTARWGIETCLCKVLTLRVFEGLNEIFQILTLTSH